MHTNRSLPLGVTTVALIAFLGLAACTAKGNSNASSTTTAAAGATTTTAAAGTTTTAETSTTTAATRAVTDAQLHAALPPASAIGAGYTIDTSPSSNDPNDPANKAITKACPDAAKILNSPDDPHDAKVSYKVANDGRGIETDAGRNHQGITSAGIDKVVAAIAKCSTIAWTDAGASYTGTLTAKRDDTYGDFGMQINYDITVAGNGQSIVVHAVGVLWERGGLTGGVLITSGFDQATGAAVPGDFDRLAPIASTIDANLKTLTS